MSTDDVFLNLDSDLDMSVWVDIPTEWPVPGKEDLMPDIPTWANVAAKVIWDDSPTEPTPQHIDVLTEILAYAAEHFPKAYPGFEILAHLPNPTDPVLPVAIGDFDVSELSPEEAETEVRLWSGVDDPNAVEPPIVEDFFSQHLGSGKRVLRYVINDDDGRVNTALRYGWYIPQLGRQTHLFAYTTDPAHLISALDDLDALARCIRYDPIR
ncbi:hypothetical protein [Streptomyces sp. ODS28]|uniref:hypothetical protein n=1 Tax=Streptomyces sp. ODS28 TaxID=3136688 RepID=UPI0031EFE9C2